MRGTTLRAWVGSAVIALLLGVGCAPNRSVHVTGTVHRFTTEGGFWAVRGDDGVTYDPIGALSPEYQVEGIRVKLDATARPDVVSAHMAGTMVDITKIQKL